VKIAARIFSLLGSLLIFVVVFHKPEDRPPDNFQLYFSMATGVCLLLAYIFQHLARMRGEYSHDHTPRNWLERAWADRSKRFWILLVIVAPLAVAGPFLAPYTGTPLSFSQEVITSAISFVLFIAIAWFASRRREASSSGFPRYGVILVVLAFIFFLAAFFFKR